MSNVGRHKNTMRSSVAHLVALGRFPSEHGAAGPEVQEFQRSLEVIEPPLTKEEAIALLSVFGQDGCFGLAWSLVHLVETAPGWPYPEARLRAANPWVKSLLERAE
jgi:hypothetical protein